MIASGDPPLALVQKRGPSPDLRAVAATAKAWNCVCHGRCGGLEAARCLTRAAQALPGDAETEPHRLLGPLSVLVSCQTTREGHGECAILAGALAVGDRAGALDSCYRLIAMEQRHAREAAGFLRNHP